MRMNVDHKAPNEYHRRVTARYSTNDIMITLPTINGKHIDRFLNRMCSLDLLNPRYELKWTAKEISESEAMFYAIRTSLRIDPTRTDVLVYVVGDGARPRTGALLAHTTKWNIVSIDPLLYLSSPEVKKIKRLVCYDSRVEEAVPVPHSCSTVLVVAPHSHAPLKNCLHLLDSRYICHVVAMPCCQNLELDKEPSKIYYDWACLSPERLVKIWKDYHAS